MQALPQNHSPQDYLDVFKLNHLYSGGLDQFRQEVKIVKKNLAQGGFGLIDEGLLIQKNQKIAIKHYSDETKHEDIEKELFNLEKIDKGCPNVLRCICFYAWLLLDDDSNPLKIKIIFPLAQADLNTLRKQGKIFSETDIELMLKQILDGLYFLKNYVGIIHRNIKPQNILCMEDGTYCITDFGISKVINKSANRNSVSVSKVFTRTVDSGTEDYLAPEIVLLWQRLDEEEQEQIEIQEMVINIEKCDIFALGITCLQILRQLKPTQFKNLNKTESEAKRLQFLVDIQSKKLKETLTNMVLNDTSKRFNIEQSLSCLMIGKVREDEGEQQTIKAVSQKLVQKQQQQIEELTQQLQQMQQMQQQQQQQQQHHQQQTKQQQHQQQQQQLQQPQKQYQTQNQPQQQAAPVNLVPVKNAKIEDLPQITLEELNKYDGVKDPKIYIAIKNIVFDVSKSEQYRQGGSYSMLAGRDASVALARMSVEEKYFIPYNQAELTQSELMALQDWFIFFENKSYPKVARLKTIQKQYEKTENASKDFETLIEQWTKEEELKRQNGAAYKNKDECTVF